MRECCRTVDKYLVGQFKTQHHEHQLVKLAGFNFDPLILFWEASTRSVEQS